MDRRSFVKFLGSLPIVGALIPQPKTGNLLGRASPYPGTNRVSLDIEGDVPGKALMSRADGSTEWIDISYQITPSHICIPISPIQMAKILKKLMDWHPEMSLDYIAEKICKSKRWIHDTLSLLNLTPEIQKLVEQKKICIANAYILARMSPWAQTLIQDQAQSVTPQEMVVYYKVYEVSEISKLRSKSYRRSAEIVLSPSDQMREAFNRGNS